MSWEEEDDEDEGVFLSLFRFDVTLLL